MEFLEIEMLEYGRFPLLGDNKLHINFKENLVLVTGKNGAGKSSLFNQLSVLPADKKDYFKHGYQKVVVEKNKKIYTLISDFTKASPSYSFLVDDEELNTAGNQSNQRLLALSHFGITSDIHDILIGNILFTEMSTNDRKKLFATLTKINLDKLLKAYGEVNNDLNSHKTMLKTHTNLYKLEETKKIDEVEFINLRARSVWLKDEIDKWLKLQRDISSFNSYVEGDPKEELRKQLKERNDIYRTIYPILTSHPRYVINDLLSSHVTNQARLKNDLTYSYKKLEELTELDKSMDIDVESLIKQIDSLKSHKENLICKTRYLDIKDGFNATISSLVHNIFHNLPPLLEKIDSNIGEDGELIYTATLGKEAEEEYRLLCQEKHKLDLIIENAHDKVKQAEALDHLFTCPDCGKSWSAKELLMKNMRQDEKINEVHKRINEVLDRITVLEKYMEECSEFLTTHVEIANIRKVSESQLSLFWKELLDSKVLITNPLSAMNFIQILTDEVSWSKEVSDCILTLNAVEKEYNDYINHKGMSSEEVKKKLAKERKLISSINFQIAFSESSVSRLNHYLKLHDLFEDKNKLIDKLGNSVRTSNMNTLVTDVNFAVDDHVLQLRIELSDIDAKIRNNEMIEYNLASIKANMDDTQESIEVMELMLDKLSPKHGLLAKTISSLLNNVTSNMNRTIEEIWDYKMEILPIDINEDALNYKFKINIEDTNTTPDISLASKGMKEGINLSFKLVLYGLLGFKNYPLYLDELASNMDANHTDKISKLIHEFSMSGAFSQIFIISHKENMSFLKDTQTISLSK